MLGIYLRNLMVSIQNKCHQKMNMPDSGICEKFFVGYIVPGGV
jgi:hypothetical protein